MVRIIAGDVENAANAAAPYRSPRADAMRAALDHRADWEERLTTGAVATSTMQC